MLSMSRFGAGSRKYAGFGIFALAFVFAVAVYPALAQQDDQAMDEDQALSISCDDGTELNALFDETSVAITLADGSKIILPQKDKDAGFLYTNGKFTLSGDDSAAEWTVGKKTSVACHFNDQQQPTHFDEPLTVDGTPLPKDKANPDAQPQVNCYRYASFMVKEVDLGEKGVESLAVTAPDAACERAQGKDEKRIRDDSAAYFFGVKGNLAFFQAADGANGGLAFVVYDTKTMKRLFGDSLEGDDFDSLDVIGAHVTMTYRRVYASDCSLYKEGAVCADKIRGATRLGGDAKLPDCGAAYDAEKKRTPDYAKEIEDLPSLISYEAELTFDGKSVTIKPLKGETACNVPA